MKTNRVMSRATSTIFIIFLMFTSGSVAWAEASINPENVVNEKNASEQKDESVIQAFASREVKKSDIVAIQDKTKRLVMFFMGVPLLILLATTVALGIAMVIFEKKVFVAHMICAGLSMTLAIAHAIVGIVWFYPF